MFLKKLQIFLLIFFSVKIVSAQKQINNWYFGANAGLDFSSGAPVALLNGQLNTLEGCSALSDSAGKLLFYTDGITVWNKMHGIMPNGTGLRGSISSTQSALIIQKPNSKNIYYIFTADCIIPGMPGIQYLCYSVVDMSLQNGLGDITVKNILLHTPSTEKVAGVRHCNGRDMWVVTHDFNSNAFRAFLIDSNGVNTNGVVSNCGMIEGSWLGNAIGYLRGSPDGTKLASAVQIPISKFSLYDFNNATGLVSNELLFPKLQLTAYGVEFSSDGTKMYGVTADSNLIYQFDLNAGTINGIIQSGQIIGRSDDALGAIAKGPDKKLYVAINGHNAIGVINYPNQKGLSCNYVNDGVSLGDRKSAYGLPNFINSFESPEVHPFTSIVSCLQATFSCQSTDGYGPVMYASWDFGDSQSKNNTTISFNPVHYFTRPGSFDVTVQLHYKCRTDTLKQTIIIRDNSFPTVINGADASCYEKASVLSTGITGSYFWSTGETTNTINVSPSTQTYSVVVTTSAGCTYTASKITHVNLMPTVTAKADKLDELTAKLEASGAVTYTWWPQYGLSCTNCSNPMVTYDGTTTYCVKGTDSNGCSNEACIELVVSAAYIPNTFTPNGDNLNDTFTPVVTEVSNYTFLIYDRWGKNIFKSNKIGEGWNGTYRNEECDETIYVYKLNFTDNVNQKAHEYAGKIMLMR